MNTLRQAIGVVSVLLLLLAVGLFFFLYERVEVEVQGGAIGEARYNPYLAAARTLHGLGLPTAPSRVMTVPADIDTALLLLAPSRVLEGEERDRLLDWVSEGGRLVVLATDEDLLLGPLGLSLVPWDFDAAPPAAWDSGDTGAATEHISEVIEAETLGEEAMVQSFLHGVINEPRVSAGHLPTTGEPVTVEHNHRDLEATVDTDWELDTLAVRVPYGLGSITALADAGFLSNDDLLEHDHAALLWALVGGGTADQPASAALVYWTQPPSLWRWLKAVAQPMLISGLALLLVWLWGASRRFGPALPDPDPGRRSLLEHLDAAGNYAWKRGDRAALLAAVRDAVIARPGVDKEAVDEALWGLGDGRDARSFTRAVSTLMTIWRER